MSRVVEVRNLSKLYTIGAKVEPYGNLRESLTRALKATWETMRRSSDNGQQESKTSLWALRNVDLDVEEGDTVAIIGSNGAGKSTLLKILSRITSPTEGTVKIRGRMASLLEVGTGFHPELTGRENVYLNGSILGMSKAEIEARFDDIVAFSGISRFLDTPVKRYSSGMKVRLAFAVAAHLEPEILVVDEVLAVGDAAFQKKCLGKMAEACTQSRTVLFVSHNLAAVEALCKKAIVLEQGAVVFTGTAKDAIQYYQHSLAMESSTVDSHIVDLGAAPGRPARCRRPLLKCVEFYTEGDAPFRGELRVGAPLKAVVHFTLEDPCSHFDASIAIDTLAGQRICTAHSAYEPDRIHEERVGKQAFVCEISSVPLVPGEYRISVGLDIARDEVDWVEGVAPLTILRSDYYGTGVVPTRGTFLLPNRWRLEPQTQEVNV
jgi:lipopolysaccharide transport system ATP-binding protein